MAIPNVVGNIAGGAQAQRFAVANFERENAAAKAAAAKQLRDGILTGLLNTGIQTAVQFGGKAYDEATSGARAQQQIDDAKAVDQFNMRVKRLDAGINMPSFDAAAKVKQDAIGSTGYGIEQETAADRSSLAGAARELAKARESAPETGYGRMGRMGIDDSASATASGVGPQRDVMPKPGPVNLGEGQRSMGAPPQPALVQRDRTDEESLAAMTNEEDRAFQARLLEARKQAAAKAIAEAAKAKQDREDTLAKDLRDAQLKSDQNMGELQQRTEQKLGPRGRPTNVPQFGVQPVVDPETGIVRPRFVEQPRVQMPVSGGGAAKPRGFVPGSDTVNVVRIPFTRKGELPGAPIPTQMNSVEWARQLVQNPDSYMRDAADLPLLAKALRIIDNPTVSMDVRANQLAFIDEAAKRGVAKWSPPLAATREAVGFSPKDAGKEQTAEKTAAEKAAQAEADRQAAIDKQLAEIEAKGIQLDKDYEKDVESRLEKTFKRRGSKGGLTMQQLRDAADGDPPPDGIDPDGLAAWQAASAAAASARDNRERTIQNLNKQVAAIKGRKQATPGGQ